MNENETIDLSKGSENQAPVAPNQAPIPEAPNANAPVNDGPVSIAKPEPNNIQVNPDMSNAPVNNNIQVNPDMNNAPVNNSVMINPNMNSVPVNNNIQVDPNMNGAPINNNVQVNPNMNGAPFNSSMQMGAAPNDFNNAQSSGSVNFNQPPVNNNNPVPEKPKKKKGALIGILVAVLIICLAGVFAYLFFFTTTFKSPKQRVMLAFSKTLGSQSFIAELSGNTKDGISKDVIDQTSGILAAASDVNTALIDKPVESDFVLTLESLKTNGADILPELSGAGITVNSAIDPKEKLASTNIAAKYNGYTFLDLGTYFDDSVVMIESDDFFDGYISFDYANLEDLEDSYIGSLLTESSPDFFDELESINQNFFDQYDKLANAQAKDVPIISAKEIKPLVDLYDKIDVTKNNTYASYTINDKKVKAYSYNVHIDKDDLVTFLEDISPYILDTYRDYLDENEELFSSMSDDAYEELYDLLDDFEDQYDELIDDIADDLEDVDFQAYIDNKCRLIAIKYVNDIESDDSDVSVEFNMEFTGYPYLCNDVYASLLLTNNDTDETIELFSSYLVTEEKSNRKTEFTIDATSDDETALSFEMIYNYDSNSGDYDLTSSFETDSAKASVTSEGNVEIDKDYFSLVYDSFELELDSSSGVTGIEISGEYTIQAAEDDIELPDGPEYDLADMDESDFEKLVMEIYGNLSDSPLYQILNEL